LCKRYRYYDHWECVSPAAAEKTCNDAICSTAKTRDDTAPSGNATARDNATACVPTYDAAKARSAQNWNCNSGSTFARNAKT
jgi:hypothetical protein